MIAFQREPCRWSAPQTFVKKRTAGCAEPPRVGSTTCISGEGRTVLCSVSIGFGRPCCAGWKFIVACRVRLGKEFGRVNVPGRADCRRHGADLLDYKFKLPVRERVWH